MDRSKGLTHLPKSVRPPSLKEETLAVVSLVEAEWSVFVCVCVCVCVCV